MSNIVFVSHYSGKGGANKELCLLIEELIKKGNKIYVVMPSKGWLYDKLNKKCTCIVQRYYRWVENCNASLIIFRRIVKWGMNWLVAYRLAIYFKNKNIDIVHTNDSITVVGAYLAQLLHKRHVWHMREIFDGQLEFKHTFSEKYCEKWMQRADCIISISKAVYDRYSQYQKLNLKLVYDGIKCCNKQPQNCINGKLVLLFCGGTSYDKGFADVLDIAERMENEQIDFLIRIVSTCNVDGKLKKYLEKKHIENRIEFLGFVDNLDEIREQSDATLMCSSSEAFGLVTVESMLAKRLVIGRAGGATSELIIDGVTGFLYNNIDEMFNCIKKIRSEETKKIVERAFQYASEQFNIEKTAQKIQDIYEEGKYNE